MARSGGDPYAVLGVQRSASDAELRSAYRRLVQLHHPDHNAGSAESARRFTEVQEAYAEIQKLRGSATGEHRPSSSPPRQAPRQAPRPGADADVESRLADLERGLRAARIARERAQEAASATAAAAATRKAVDGTGRPSDEELGYYTTDDSFSKIVADARSELSDIYAEARQQPIVKHVAELIDELASRLNE
ncbi:MAG: J domain-containing protein [Solirubrobacteraceae bacterium]